MRVRAYYVRPECKMSDWFRLLIADATKHTERNPTCLLQRVVASCQRFSESLTIYIYIYIVRVVILLITTIIIMIMIMITITILLLLLLLLLLIIMIIISTTNTNSTTFILPCKTRVPLKPRPTHWGSINRSFGNRGFPVT